MRSRGPIERDSRRGPEGRPRWELGILAVTAVAWLLTIAVHAGWLPLAGRLPLGLYGYYSFSSLLGWVAGNAWVERRGRRPRGSSAGRLRLLGWLSGPPGLLFLIRALAPAAAQAAAPLVPVWALGVYWIFFAVPVSFGFQRRR